MKCPACENDVPSGQSACSRCGVALPSAGDRPGPRFGSGSSEKTQPGGPNPQTEPFPMPDWDTDPNAEPPSAGPSAESGGKRPEAGSEEHTWGVDAERSWGAPPESHGSPGPHSASGPHSAPGPYGAPDPYGARDPYGAPDPFGTPDPYGAPDPRKAPDPYGASDPYGAPDPYGTPSPDAPPLTPDAATQGFGAPGPNPEQPRPPGFGTGGPNAPGTGPMPLPGPDAWNPSGAPGAPPAGDDSGKGRKMLLAGVVAAVVVLGGVLAVVVAKGLSGSGDKTAAPQAKAGATSASQQATAVDQILKSGRVARGHLPGQLRTCDDVAQGVPGFQQVVRDRQQELSQSNALTVDRLPDGARLRRSMIAAYRHSLAADQAYLAWAQEIQARGCGGKIAPLTAHYKDAIAANGKAGPAKRQVVALWRPIAGAHGLPTYPWNRL